MTILETTRVTQALTQDPPSLSATLAAERSLETAIFALEAVDLWRLAGRVLTVLEDYRKATS